MLEGYINEDGFVTVQRNANPFPGEGNGWLQTGLAAACGANLSFLKTKEMFERCRFSVEVPMLWRSPHKKNLGDNQNHDDMWGAGLLAWWGRFYWAKEFVELGTRTNWIYDITDPNGENLRYKFDRFFDFIPYMRLCAREKLTIADSLILAATIVFDAYHLDKADGNMRAFCKVTVAGKDGNLICKLACAWWRKRAKAKYGTIGKSWAEYFGEGHPLNAFNEVNK